MNLIQYRNTLRGGKFVVGVHFLTAAQYLRIRSAFLADLYERVLCN